MVSEGYVNRLRDYITAECVAHARRPGDKGVNAYSRYTERILSEWDLPGFAAGQISRWLRGEVKAELDGRTLQRLGLLKELSREPEEAGKLAWAWLNGDGEPEPTPGVPLTAAEQLAANYIASVDADFVLEQIKSKQFSSVQLKEIAIAAVEQLAANVEDNSEVEESTPRESALTWLLQGWMTQRGSTVADLAVVIGTSVERTQKIIQGYPMTVPECMAVADLTRLKPETLAEWGLCPTLVSSHAEDRT